VLGLSVDLLALPYGVASRRRADPALTTMFLSAVICIASFRLEPGNTINWALL